MNKLHTAWFLCITILFSQTVLAKTESEQIVAAQSSMTVDAAINKALKQSPRLNAYRSAALAADGEKTQAGALPNPEIEVEAENIEGSGSYNGFDSAEIKYGVSQLIEVGGKRSSRRTIAEHGQKMADFDYQAAALDLIRDVTVAYNEVVASEEGVKLAKEQNKLANEVMGLINARVNAAAAPLTEKSRGQVELAASTVVLSKAMRQRDMSYKNLAMLMGDERVAWQISTESFFTVTKPNAEESAEKLKRNPNLMKLNAALQQSKARLDLEKANAIPDPTLSIGMKKFRDTDDQALTVGMSIPLPVFNTNRGNIMKMGHEVSQTGYENQDAVLLMNASLEQTNQALNISYSEANTFINDILPSAQQAFELSSRAYKADKLPYFEVLDTQRTFFDVKQQYLEALKNYHIYRAEVERLTATHLERIETIGEQQ